MRVLVVNAGSSSLKLRLLDGDTLAWSHDGKPGDPLPELPEADAVGHRIVHGGIEFREAVRIDDDVRRRLEALSDLAPLHQPKSLAALDRVHALLPALPHVACFDTAFHQTLPAAAATYALPAEWRARFGVRRYGFHGLSHAYVSRRARELLGRAPRIVTCHLGSGASLAAVLEGKSVDTTMGFTPLEGLVMSTRSGSVDPGLLLWLQEHEHLEERALAEALEHRSGLLGLAGTADMRVLLARTDADATLALGVYLHRLRASIAAMTAALGGLDALVFTGGVGENAAAIRTRAVEGLGYLGLALDEQANAEARPDADVSAGWAKARTLVISAREDLEIASQVRALLGVA
jgi:acetate kinase